MMTDASDPGLTDLIAAHHPSGHYMATNEIRCGCGWLGPASDWPAHVALVVEQHTNGRIAELEADRANWKSYYNDAKQVIEAGTVNWTATILDRDDWKARAEKAEATIDRAWAIIPRVIQGVGRNATYMDVGRASGKEQVWKQLRAALEGEQQ